MSNKNNKYLLIILIALLILIVAYFLKNIIINEVEQYKLYNDYTRGNQVMTLSFNKNFDLQSDTIRGIQSSDYSKKLSKGDLIYNFASYDFIPILNYLYEKDESEELLNSFSLIMDFIANYNTAIYNDREEILMIQNNGKYFYKEKGVYTYEVEKKIISKEAFNNLYKKYLNTINKKNVSDNFVDKLLNRKKIKYNYTSDELLSVLNRNYKNFYSTYKEDVIKIISEDLKAFADYLNTYLIIDKVGNEKPKLITSIETKKIHLFFNFKKLDRIYVPYSKYYRYSYQLDLDSLWNQLEDLELPKLYV